jgi:hypothetical protein
MEDPVPPSPQGLDHEEHDLLDQLLLLSSMPLDLTIALVKGHLDLNSPHDQQLEGRDIVPVPVRRLDLKPQLDELVHEDGHIHFQLIDGLELLILALKEPAHHHKQALHALVLELRLLDNRLIQFLGLGLLIGRDEPPEVPGQDLDKVLNHPDRGPDAAAALLAEVVRALEALSLLVAVPAVPQLVDVARAGPQPADPLALAHLQLLPAEGQDRRLLALRVPLADVLGVVQHQAHCLVRLCYHLAPLYRVH